MAQLKEIFETERSREPWQRAEIYLFTEGMFYQIAVNHVVIGIEGSYYLQRTQSIGS